MSLTITKAQQPPSQHLKGSDWHSHWAPHWGWGLHWRSLQGMAMQGEAGGQMVQWMVEEGCKAHQWPQCYPSGIGPSVAINITLSEVGEDSPL